MSEHHFSFRAMNTEVDVLLELETDEQKAKVQNAFEDIRFLFEQVEEICSRFLPDSELSQLNQTAEQEVSVSPLLFDVLTAAEEAYQSTQGLYHPGLLGYLEAAGYDRSRELIQDSPDEAVRLPKPSIAVPPFVLNKEKRTVTVTPGMKIDLGGIGKGWTVDRAAQHLQRLGPGLINAGGDLRTFGQDRRWNIGVEDPFAPEQDLGILTVGEGAVATSTRWKRRWKKGAVWMHHLLDPRTGLPSQSDVISATVLANTATEADVLAKTVLILGLDEGSEWIRKRGYSALLVGQNRKIRRVGCELV